MKLKNKTKSNKIKFIEKKEEHALEEVMEMLRLDRLLVNEFVIHHDLHVNYVNGRISVSEKELNRFLKKPLKFLKP